MHRILARLVTATVAVTLVASGAVLFAPEANAAPAQVNRTVCKTSSLTVRTAAKSSSKSVGRVARNTSLTGVPQGSWFKITSGQFAGRFVRSSYVCAPAKPKPPTLKQQLASLKASGVRTGVDAGGLNPEFAARLNAARSAAANAGYSLTWSTAYRSWDTQWGLFYNGVVRRNSMTEARRWVMTPWESMHVRGLAVDINNAAAAAWLERTNGQFGLCRRYVNESWHFEILGAVGAPCPAKEADASRGNPLPG